MNIFKSRPLALFCFLFIIVSAVLLSLLVFGDAANSIPFSSTTICICVCVIGILVPMITLILRFALPPGTIVLKNIGYAVGIGLAITVSAIVVLFGAVKPSEEALSLTEASQESEDEDAGSIIEADVVKVITRTSYTSGAIVKIKSVDGSRKSIKALVYSSDPGIMNEGEAFRANVSFSSLESKYPADSCNYYLSEGVMLYAQIKSDYKCTKTSSGLRGKAADLKDSLKLRLIPIVKKDTYSFFEAVVLADRADIKDSLTRDFRTLGISHMLAVSGLHLAIILGALEIIFNLFSLPYIPRAFIRIAFTLVYMTMCGFTPSIVRAGVMFIIMILASLAGEDYDPVTALFFAAALICAFSPCSLFDTGFLLSFSATLGLVTFGADISFALENKLTPFLRMIIMSLAVSVCAIMMTLPVVSLRFGYVSLAGPIANIVMAPVLSAFLYTSLFALLFAHVPVIAPFSGFVLDKLYLLIEYLSGKAERLGDCVVRLDSAYAKIAVALILLLIIAVIVIRIRKRLIRLAPIFVSVLLLASLAFIPSAYADRTAAVIYSDNNNDTILLESNDKCAIIDISSGGSYDASGIVYFAQSEFGETNVDAYMLTHLHAKHVSTLRYLAENYRLSYLILPQDEDDDEDDESKYVSKALSKVCDEYGITMIEYSCEDSTGSLEFAKAKIEFTRNEKLRRSTHPVISLKISANNSTLAYFGASYFELPGASFDLSGYDYTIIGSHGPKIKNQADIVKQNPTSLLIFSSDETASHYEFDPAGAQILQEDEYRVIVFE